MLMNRIQTVKALADEWRALARKTLAAWAVAIAGLVVCGADGEAILRRWSPLSLLNARTPPFVFAYNKLHPFSGTDGMVETSHAEDMAEALEQAGVESATRFCWFRFHGQFTDWQLDWIAETCADYERRFL